MKRTIGLMLAMVFAMAVWMPVDTSAQIWRTREYQSTRERREHQQRERQRRWRSRYYQNMGYRNYGQYRRNEARYRRYRMERQYYYLNGRRYTRMVRIYF